MNHVTQENAANSEQSSASAAELNGEVRRLSGLIARFDLGTSSSGSAHPTPEPVAAPVPVASTPALTADARSAFPRDEDFSDF